MGMSAGQARLLTITGRLTDNELRSQIITNSKLRLAAKSSDASNAYMDALNSQQLMYGVYNDKGEYTTKELSPSIIYNYQPLKNQYAIVNNAGKIFVSPQDAKNFEATDSLSDFLDCYDLVESVTVSTQTVVDNPDYKILMEEYEKEHEIWEAEEPKESDFTTVGDNSLYDNYMSMIQSSACYNLTYNSGKRCYMHLLGALIGLGPHTTSDGNTFEIKSYADNGGWYWNTSEYATVDDLSRSVTDAIKEKKCDCGDADCPFGEQTIYQAVVDFMYSSKDLYDGSATGGDATEEELSVFMHIVEVELKQALTDFDDEAFNKAYNDWLAREPQKPTVPATKVETTTTEYITVNDEDKAQWYTNLWYMMNGSETANLIKQEEVYDNVSEITRKVLSLDSASKTTTGGNYEVFNSNLYKSSEWLQFALEHGMVTLYRAQYENPSADSGKALEMTSEGITWSSIVYTNASDITSVEDEAAIARAEVKYQNAMREIENEDKKFDQDLKKLDVEHSALQTEYESLKSTIEKNVERSFKAFS